MHSDGRCERCRKVLERKREWARTCGIGARHLRIRDWAGLRPPASGADRWQRVVDALARFAASPDGAILALVGPRGVGKSQLAAVAVCETICTGRRGVYVTLPDLLADLKRRYSSAEPGDGDAAWLEHWAAPHLLIVDEIAERTESGWADTMLTALVDARYRELRPSILAGNVAKDDFAAVVPASICSRINEGGGLIVCDWASFRERGAEV